MLYISQFYTSVFQCAEKEMDLKVANDVHAKMCPAEFDDTPGLRVTFTMPRDCKPLKQWLKTNSDLKDRLLVLQQLLNSLATIHTQGHKDDLTLWGSFMVWVAKDMRVYLLVDFPMLLAKQQEVTMSASGRFNPRLLDVMAVREIYTSLVTPCIARDRSWASPALRNSLCLFEGFLADAWSSCRMAEAARILGEKRVCKVEVCVAYSLSVVFYCLEREELQTALRDLSRIAPSGISPVWAIQSVSQGTFMRVGDIVTADRRMQLQLVPGSHPGDPRHLYIHCQQ
jgi:hypothetical protein